MTLFNLAAAVVPSGARRTYRIPLLGVELDVAPMTKANKPFWSEFLTMVSAWRTAGDAGDEALTEATQALNRRRDVPLMAKHVLVGWRGVTDASGAPVPFSPEKAADFLMELATTDGAEYLFDGLQAFARDPANFTNGAIAAAKALSGNLSGG